MKKFYTLNRIYILAKLFAPGPLRAGEIQNEVFNELWPENSNLLNFYKAYYASTGCNIIFRNSSIANQIAGQNQYKNTGQTQHQNVGMSGGLFRGISKW
jgi:hypothetical protein